MKSILSILLGLGLASIYFTSCNKGIDRETLVKRHTIVIEEFDTLNSLTVGNGSFAFTVDPTGLQSFPELYEKGIPLGTFSDWGWHSFPNPENYKFEESYRSYNLHGREINYPVQWREPGRKQDAANWLRTNPHRLHLGIVGLVITKPDGSKVQSNEIKNIHQELNMWTGEITSTYDVMGEPVEVVTVCHQELDLVGVKINSPLVNKGVMKITLKFPYPSGKHTDSGCEWNQQDKHKTNLITEGTYSCFIERELDSTTYRTTVLWDGNATVYQREDHEIDIDFWKGRHEVSFIVWHTPDYIDVEIPDFSSTQINSQEAWKSFWLNGGAIDFSGSTDERAHELERRIILSQYLTKVNCSNIYPPAETGLTCNSWYGKFHLEMHWWHGVHFALWNRIELLEKSLDWYNTVIHEAKDKAEKQGFEGVRWQKMTDPRGKESPSSVGPFLIWQQPHLIYFSELCYRHYQNPEVLEKYKDLVFATAEFMASYAYFDSTSQRYVLGPALIPAQERFHPDSTINPTFEVHYWYWGLTTAQLWRERLGLERNTEWDKVINSLSELPVLDSLYLAVGSTKDSYTRDHFMSDHPMVLGTVGFLPESPKVDMDIMEKTFDYIWDVWHWEETWGWDFPLTAMCATRLGKPDQAIDALFMNNETNIYLKNGHNYQDKRLRLYLPGNGGLLTAAAMMTAGYDGCDIELPGIPKDETWQVRWEGLAKMP